MVQQNNRKGYGSIIVSFGISVLTTFICINIQHIYIFIYLSIYLSVCLYKLIFPLVRPYVCLPYATISSCHPSMHLFIFLSIIIFRKTMIFFVYIHIRRTCFTLTPIFSFLDSKIMYLRVDIHI